MPTPTTTPTPDVADPALDQDDPIVAHIVAPDGKRSGHAIVTEAMVNGTPVTALCGHTWVPRRDPQNRPKCPVCVEILDRIRNRSTN